jgi:hypothetical protein
MEIIEDIQGPVFVALLLGTALAPRLISAHRIVRRAGNAPVA